MSTLTIGEVEVPFDVQTLEGFRRWAATRDGRAPLVAYVNGHVFVELSQSYRTHAPLTSEVNAVLHRLAREDEAGMYLMAPSWFTCEPADVSAEPDGFFARFETLQAGLLQVNPEREHEMVGRPDFVFEAVSRSSQRKDLVEAVSGYARAGIPEYWIIDARQEPDVAFRLLVLRGGAYEEVAPDAEGWRASPCWGRGFRVRRVVNPAGLADYRLDVRA